MSADLLRSLLEPLDLETVLPADLGLLGSQMKKTLEK
jgi:hypothetical protein